MSQLDTSFGSEPEQLYTLNEVAALVKRHRKTLDKDIASGRLHVVHIAPRSPRVTASELVRYSAGLSQVSGQDGSGSGIMKEPTDLPRRKS